MRDTSREPRRRRIDAYRTTAFPGQHSNCFNHKSVCAGTNLRILSPAAMVLCIVRSMFKVVVAGVTPLWSVMLVRNGAYLQFQTVLVCFWDKRRKLFVSAVIHALTLTGMLLPAFHCLTNRLAQVPSWFVYNFSRRIVSMTWYYMAVMFEVLIDTTVSENIMSFGCKFEN